MYFSYFVVLEMMYSSLALRDLKLTSIVKERHGLERKTSESFA